MLHMTKQMILVVTEAGNTEEKQVLGGAGLGSLSLKWTTWENSILLPWLCNWQNGFRRHIFGSHYHTGRNESQEQK